MPRSIFAKLLAFPLAAPKNGTSRRFRLFGVLGFTLFLSFSAAALDLTVWKPSPHGPGIILAVKNGETPAQAAQRFEAAVSQNSELMPLIKRSPFPILEKTHFEDLKSSDFNRRTLIIANMPQDIAAQGERMRSILDPLYGGGVTPYLVPLAADLGLSKSEAQLFIELLDNAFMSFVAIGGDDIDRRVFNEENIRSTNVNLVRDRFEAALIKRKVLTITSKLVGRSDRLLAICRGAQLAAKVMGYDVGHDITEEIKGPIRHGRGLGEGSSHAHSDEEPSHPIQIFKTSKSIFYNLTGRVKNITANTYHHQWVIHSPNPKAWVKLQLAAVSPDDGVTEALEYDDSILLLQMHPELMAVRSAGEMQQVGKRMMTGLAQFLSPRKNNCEGLLGEITPPSALAR